MTIQEAANEILKEQGKPINSRDIASIALDKGMVTSSAQDPVQSHAQTIEKNIRDEVYNNPKLIFIPSSQGRLIGLPGWEAQALTIANKNTQRLADLRANIPRELLEKIGLAEQAKLRNNFNDTVSLILTKGISVLAPEIKEGLMKQLSSLKSL